MAKFERTRWQGVSPADREDTRCQPSRSYNDRDQVYVRVMDLA